MPDFQPRRESANEPTLQARLGRPLPVGMALDLAIQIGQALDRLHRDGRVYGCLAPATVLLPHQDSVVLVEPRLIQTLATTAVAYRAPEQVAGQPAEPSGDVYALGCILYEMLTGLPPSGERPALPRRINPAVPKTVERVVLQALVQEPQGRFPTAGAMMAALRHCRPAWARKPLAAWDRVALRLAGGIGLRRAAVLAAIAALVIVGLAVGVPLFIHSSRQQAARDQLDQIAALLARGESHLLAGEWEQALAACHEALALDPEDAQARACADLATEGRQHEDWFAQGLAYLGQEQWQQALGRFTQLRQVRPDYPGLEEQLAAAHLGYGLHLLDTGQVEEASAHFDQLLAANPGDGAVQRLRQQAGLYLEGTAWYKSGNWAAAAAALHTLYELDPAYQPELPDRLCSAYLEQGKVLEAAQAWCAAWQAYDQAAHVPAAGAGEAQERQAQIEIRCWPPTATPVPTPTPTPTSLPTATPAPTPTPRATARPIRYCWAGEFQGTAEQAFPLISITGKVLDRNGNGVQNALVRVQAWNVAIEVRTGRQGGFRVDGLSEPIEWTVSLPEYGVEVVASLTQHGQIGLVEFREERCR